MTAKPLKPVDRKISHRERKYIAYCEEYYFVNNYGFPTNEQAAVALGYSPAEVAVFLQNIQTQKALDRRGLPWRTALTDSIQGNNKLTPIQMAVAITVSNFADDRHINEKLSELGVLPAQYYVWLNDPNFQSFVNKLADRNLEIVRPEAVASFNKLIRDGDFAAIKYYFEVTGQFSTPEIHNIQILVQKLVESVQRHVKDPEILAAISRDILGAAPVAGSIQVLTSTEVSSGNNGDS